MFHPLTEFDVFMEVSLEFSRMVGIMFDRVRKLAEEVAGSPESFLVVTF